MILLPTHVVVDVWFPLRVHASLDCDLVRTVQVARETLSIAINILLASSTARDL